MSMSRSMSLFVASQASLYVGLIICMIIRPESLRVNEGISYFGNFPQTIIPYALGLLISIGLAVAAGWALAPGPYTGPVKWGLYAFALGGFGILITPSLSVTWISLTHEWIGAALFFLQFILTTWIVLYIKRDWLNIGLLGVLIAAGLAAAFYLNPPVGLLMQCQLIFQIAFGLIILRSLEAIESMPAAAAIAVRQPKL